MPKRKERTLKELYDVTEKIMEPEITPVLRGSCRIQGPIDETDRDIQKNTVSYRGEKRFGRHFVSERICKRAESGTCNVCSAPCSSCMHLNRAVSHMELKAEDEFSDETSRGKAASRCSFNVADVQPPFKNRAWGDRQCAASETSNVVSASSSHESFCENAESKATLRTCRTSDASEDVEMLPKVLSGGTTTEDQSPSKRESVSVPSSILAGADVVKRTFSNRFEEQRSLECHDDNISCVSGANDANNPVADLSVVVDRKNKSSSSASVSSLLPKGFQEDNNVQSVPGCMVDIKCEVEENGKFRRPSLPTKEFLQNRNPTITSAAVGCLTKSGLQESPSPKDFCAGNGPQEVPSPFSHSESGKSPCHNSDAKDLEENLSHHLDDPSECFTKHPESPLPKLDTPSVGAEKLAMRSCNDILPTVENSKVSLMSSSSGPSVKIYPCVDSEMDMHSGDSPAESVKCLDHIEKVEKSIVSLEVPDVEEPPLHSQPVDDSDDSDIVEDVKVCDICGDAGREDLLAICSRCGDGAEHTYCMRIMVDKVPEGDWLCEECKLKEEAENQKQEKLVVGASKVSCTNEKSNYESILSPKVLPKIPDVDANRGTPKFGSHSQFSTKRQLDSLESVPAAKRQALDTGSGSPKPSSPGKKAALVRESSFKNLDKGRVKAVHSSGGPSTTTTTTQNNPHSPSTSGPNSSRIPPRQLSRGTLLKSNSFTSYSKPKIKQIQDEFLKKPKSARDTAATETKKEGLIRRIDKSLSFHSASSRPNSTVKNKVHSSNTGNEDPRGLKLAKERNFIERKNTLKADRSVISSPKAGSGGATPKADQKALRSETLPVFHPATNYRDIKAVQPNGRLSKPASLLANRGLDIPKSLAVGGDLRRQSSCLSRGILSPLSAMTSSADHKPTQVSPKDEPTTSSLRPSDRPCSSPDAVDGLHQSQECISQSKQTISAGDNSTRCHKCKETGHAAQFYPLGTSHISILEASAVKSSKEGPNKINKLKGAVEAVMLRKAEAHKNIRMPGQSNELTMSSTDLNCEVAKDHPSTSSCLRSLTSVEAVRDGQDGFRSSSTDSSRSRTMTNVNTLHPAEAVCTPTAGDSDCLIFSNGNKLKPLLTESLSTASTVVGPLSTLSIPEYDYIWQGGFNVRRSGRPMELYDGIQAHLSTCASPKVLEAMNKVPCNVLLEEVPRLSTWPSQFHTGATEDNIALYFFAKDFESYERNYKSLVENLIKNDLALKGYLDGVELLIFSSNQLPEKSQRWNMIFFLWGVFRGRKVNCSEQTYASQTKLCGADLNEMPDPTMTVSQRDCSSGDAKDLPTICRSLNEQKAIKTTITVDLSCSSSSGKRDNHDGANLHSSDSPLGSVLGTNSSSRISATDEPHAEMIGNNNSMDEQKDIGSKRVELETRFGVIEQNNGLDNGNKVQVNLDNLNCIEASLPSTSSDWKERLPGSFKVLPVGTYSLPEEVSFVGRRVEENIRERSNGDAVILLEKIKEEEGMIGAKTYLDSDLMKKEYDSSGLKSSRKRPCSASGETFTGASQSMPWTAKVDYIVVDEESEYKRMKSGYSEMCGSSSSSSRDQSSLSGRFPSQMHNHSSIFPIKEQRLGGSSDDMGVPEDSLTTERRFFPMDLGPVKDWRVGGNSIPLHVVSSDDEDQPESEFPNLELALGGEKKPSKQQGMLPLFAALEKKNEQEMLPDINVKAENREEDVLASLSLSLAFPFSEKELSVKSVSQPEAPLPARQPVDTSLILFGGFSDT